MICYHSDVNKAKMIIYLPETIRSHDCRRMLPHDQLVNVIGKVTAFER